MTSTDHPLAPSRRGVLAAGIAVPLGGAVLAACSSGSGTTQDGAAPASGEGSGVRVATADVPVGSSYLDRDANVVLSQPTEGEFTAFDATCPHQGCAVSEVDGPELVCPCHGSRFDGATGAVLAGPATEGLTEVGVTVEGAELVLDEGR